MEAKTKKNIFLIVGILVLSIAWFCAGFGVSQYRFNRISGTDATDRVQAKLADTQRRIEQLEADRARYVEQLQSQQRDIEAIGECIGNAKKLTSNAKDTVDGLTDPIEQIERIADTFEYTIDTIERILGSSSSESQ